MRAVTDSGGVGIVQEPDEAKVPDMPGHAMKDDSPSYTLPAGSIAPLLINLINGSGDEEESGDRAGRGPSQ